MDSGFRKGREASLGVVALVCLLGIVITVARFLDTGCFKMGARAPMICGSQARYFAILGILAFLMPSVVWVIQKISHKDK